MISYEVPLTVKSECIPNQCTLSQRNKHAFPGETRAGTSVYVGMLCFRLDVSSTFCEPFADTCSVRACSVFFCRRWKYCLALREFSSFPALVHVLISSFCTWGHRGYAFAWAPCYSPIVKDPPCLMPLFLTEHGGLGLGGYSLPLPSRCGLVLSSVQQQFTYFFFENTAPTMAPPTHTRNERKIAPCVGFLDTRPAVLTLFSSHSLTKPPGHHGGGRYHHRHHRDQQNQGFQ